jgi:dihydrolipoamide dehydrogenase
MLPIKIILVNAYNATNIPGYYAIGDVTPGRLAHVHLLKESTVEKIAGLHVELRKRTGCTYATLKLLQ